MRNVLAAERRGAFSPERRKGRVIFEGEIQNALKLRERQGAHRCGTRWRLMEGLQSPRRGGGGRRLSSSTTPTVQLCVSAVRTRNTNKARRPVYTIQTGLQKRPYA